MDSTPQPNTQTALRVQQNEINQLTENRLYLMAMLEDTRAEAVAEIAMRDSEIASLKAQLAETKP